MSNFASGYVKYINHLEQINDAALLRPKAMIDEVEDAYREHLRNIARNIVSHYGTAKVCMLAGPSSSGKTTTAHLLRALPRGARAEGRDRLARRFLPRRRADARAAERRARL